jgi:hypothetical protein
MARRRSWFTKLVVFGVLALAAFGAYTLYDNNRDQANQVVQKIKRASKTLAE